MNPANRSGQEIRMIIVAADCGLHCISVRKAEKEEEKVSTHSAASHIGITNIDTNEFIAITAIVLNYVSTAYLIHQIFDAHNFRGPRI